MAKPQDPSPQATALFKNFLNDPATTIEQLTERLETYLEFVARVSEVNPRVDVDLARRIARTLGQLMELAPEEKFKYVQAATRYFIEDEDAEADLLSADGFDDDIQIVNSVCHHLGRDDLQLV